MEQRILSSGRQRSPAGYNHRAGNSLLTSVGRAQTRLAKGDAGYMPTPSLMPLTNRRMAAGEGVGTVVCAIMMIRSGPWRTSTDMEDVICGARQAISRRGNRSQTAAAPPLSAWSMQT